MITPVSPKSTPLNPKLVKSFSLHPKFPASISNSIRLLQCLPDGGRKREKEDEVRDIEKLSLSSLLPLCSPQLPPEAHRSRRLSSHALSLPRSVRSNPNSSRPQKSNRPLIALVVVVLQLSRFPSAVSFLGRHVSTGSFAVRSPCISVS